MIRLPRTLIVATVAAFVPLTVAAHPASTTSVTIVVRMDRSLTATLDTDALALSAKLELASDLPLDASANMPPRAMDLRSRINRRASFLLEQIEIGVVDPDSRVALQVASIGVDASGRASVTLTGTLPGEAQAITWSSRLTYGAYPVVIKTGANQESLQWLEGSERSAPVSLTGPRHEAGSRAVWLGVSHILPNGLDHILFVLGLLLLGSGLRPLLAQVTAFTLAHSITLGLSLYGVVSLPSSILEPLIALSVAYVGVENLLTSRVRPWRIAVVFSFGLLHGLGFAEALANLHLARQQFLATLVSFNVGVELGQLSVIVGAFAFIRIATLLRADLTIPLLRLGSGAVACVGLVWAIQRLI